MIIKILFAAFIILAIIATFLTVAALMIGTDDEYDELGFRKDDKK